MKTTTNGKKNGTKNNYKNSNNISKSKRKAVNNRFFCVDKGQQPPSEDVKKKDTAQGGATDVAGQPTQQ